MSKTNDAEVRLNAFFDTLSDELKGSLCVSHEARDRLVHRMRKRAELSKSGLAEKGMQNFKEINTSLKSFEHNLDGELLCNARHYILVMLERYTSSVAAWNIQNPLDLTVLLDFWRFGPGASNGISGSHAAQKIDASMTCTTLCEPYVRYLRANNAYFNAFDSANGINLTQIYGSRLTTVPKNEDTVRTIAIEPSGNMCLQLAAGVYLENTLRYIGLDIRNQQEKNKSLACRGSIDGTVCTIDLKSASDMISTGLVRALFPKVWYDFLMKIRSPVIQIQGEEHELNMISTMGNGFTFPMMTLILTALIYSFRCSRGGPNLYIDWSSTAVFGDDIIVATDEYEGVCDVLKKAGFLVNHEKSYSSGPFRESCGGDYYSGSDITPFYVRSLARDPEIYVCINQLLLWSARHSLWPLRSLRLLYSYLRSDPLFVPEWYSPDSGVQTALVSRKFKYLAPVKVKVPYKGNYAMMLACGGYLTGGASNTYTPRPSRKRPLQYKLRSARLPKGFLDGSDLISRSVMLSGRIVMIIAMAR